MEQAEADYEIVVGETVSELTDRILAPIFPEKTSKHPILFAVNNKYVDGDYALREGDELAMIPPVAGG